jgi:hypothetical protein
MNFAIYIMQIILPFVVRSLRTDCYWFQININLTLDCSCFKYTVSRSIDSKDFIINALRVELVFLCNSWTCQGFLRKLLFYVLGTTFLSRDLWFHFTSAHVASLCLLEYDSNSSCVSLNQVKCWCISNIKGSYEFLWDKIWQPDWCISAVLLPWYAKWSLSVVLIGAIVLLFHLNLSNNDIQAKPCGSLLGVVSEECKEDMVLMGILPPLLLLAQSSDIRVQRNATGALLNLSHLRE